MDKSKQSTTEPTNTNENFVSCIKIGGFRILPPLLTEEKRAVMRNYKMQAIEMEQKIKTGNTKKPKNKCEDAGRFVLHLDEDNFSSSNSLESSSGKSSNEDETIPSPVVCEINTSADILNMLKDFKIAKPRFTAAVKMPLLDTSAINNVPLNANFESDNKNSDSNIPLSVVDNGHVTKLNLTTKMARRENSYNDANQVFGENVLKELTNTRTNMLADAPNVESCSNQIQRFGNNNVNNKCDDSSADDSISDRNDNKVTRGTTDSQYLSRKESVDHSDSSVCITDLTNTENKENDSTSVPHRLIRSNSYILDTPSPMLLAQIEQNYAQNSDKVKTKELVVRKRRSWDLASAREKWSSTDLNLIPSQVKIVKQDYDISDIGSGKIASNSLPTSTVPSPILNIDTMKRAQPQKFKFKTPETQRNFVESFVTPVRSLNQDIDRKRRLSQEYVRSEPKQTKIFSFVKKTDNISLSRPHTLALKKQVVNDSSSSATTSSCKTPTKSDTCILPNSSDICTNMDDRIRDILDKIQSQQSKQMLELIERQRKEQKNLMKMFAAQQSLLLTTLKNNVQPDMSPYSPIDLQTVEPKGEIPSVIIIDNHPASNHRAPDTLGIDVLKNTENVMVECKKLLNSNSFTEQISNPSFTNVSSPDDTLADLTIRSEQNDSYSPHSEFLSTYVECQKGILTHSASVPHQTVSDSTKFSRSFSEDSLEPTAFVFKSARKESRKQDSALFYKDRSRTSAYNRQLFPSDKQIWAASKICAGIRGYLIRRLMRTDRVQNLILTIKDTLLCAMELHHETVENIRPADVELHRRLIQQVTAACYTFHEMFFGLSKSEQMAVISADRERLRERAMRPASARSTTSITTTTQRVLERKLRRASNDCTSAAPSRSSSSRSCHSVPESRTRTKSLGLSDSMNSAKKTSPQNDVMRRAMSYGANKKPWR